MIRIKNNPIDIMLEVFDSYYPDKALKIKEISFADLKTGYAKTVFANDEIYIYISPIVKKSKPITFEIATELLAHELAHVICPNEDNPHNEEWEQAFDKLNELYNKKAKERI